MPMTGHISSSAPIYLDYNATTPHAPEVIAAMRPFLETEFGNPSSSHWYGKMPRKAVERARRQVAVLLRCDPDEVIFTGGGTESNNLAIKGIALALQQKGRHIITSRIEHPAVTEVCRYLAKFGFEITWLPVDSFGLVQIADLESAIRPDTILISIMHANNEVGTIQPIAEISRLARERGIFVHTDAAQSIGKIDVNVRKLGVELLSVAGHKLYAPKGVGALYIDKSVSAEVLMHGAGQEQGRRAGTENVLEIVGLGAACELITRSLPDYQLHMQRMRNLLQDGLKKNFPDLRLNGHPEKRLPNTLSVSFRGLPADRILEDMEQRLAASAGAACHSNDVKVSHVLEAMNVSLNWAMGTLRLSTGRMTTEAEINRAIKIISDSAEKIKKSLPPRT